uniref:Uncharacterized protein n=1 Tax=Mucochytrium quahogii TaxID=96639 RepID=A0A7S2SJA0_9STRA|mmetsp:Transcript_5359/g.8317  ORF Transcript_5359/g.8317 Transcript_5359/m.8317 type:complete len:555 (+) Transcript_5359:110-1774(+)
MVDPHKPKPKGVGRFKLCMLLSLVVIGLIDLFIHGWVASVPVRSNMSLGMATPSNGAHVKETVLSFPLRFGDKEAAGGDIMLGAKEMTVGDNSLVITPHTETNYKISLSQPPLDDVAIVLKDLNECYKSISPQALLFTLANWDVKQLVEFEFVDGDSVNEDKNCDISHNLYSSDPRYDQVFVVSKPYTSREASIVSFLKGNQLTRLESGDPDVQGVQEALPSTDVMMVTDTIDNFRDPNVNLSAILADFTCYQNVNKNAAVKCVLGEGLYHQTFVYIVSAEGLEDLSIEAPYVMIVGGVHGKEHAGFSAAGWIKDRWRPVQGRFIVIDRMNRKGVERNTRYVPPDPSKVSKSAKSNSTKGLKSNSTKAAKSNPECDVQRCDLNRVFPLDPDSQPSMELAQFLWNFTALVKPKFFIDMHEGWGFYGENQAHVTSGANNGHLVGNPNFSKGSTIITSPNAKAMGEIMKTAVNANITEKKHKFEVLSPPIEGGLARRVNNAFGAMSIVFETTQKMQSLEKRVTQQLTMAGALLREVGFLHKDFKVENIPSINVVRVE